MSIKNKYKLRDLCKTRRLRSIRKLVDKDGEVPDERCLEYATSISKNINVVKFLLMNGARLTGLSISNIINNQEYINNSILKDAVYHFINKTDQPDKIDQIPLQHIVVDSDDYDFELKSIDSKKSHGKIVELDEKYIFYLPDLEKKIKPPDKFNRFVGKKSHPKLSYFDMKAVVMAKIHDEGWIIHETNLFKMPKKMCKMLGLIDNAVVSLDDIDRLMGLFFYKN